jgi:hypothetical protein
MSSKINIRNLFHILSHFWIHHTKNWILKFLSKKSAHLQMAMKHCTKFQVSLFSRKGEDVSIRYFILSTSLGSTITQRKVIESSCPINMLTYKWQWSIVQSHLRGEVSTSYFKPSIPMNPPQFRMITGSSHSGCMKIYTNDDKLLNKISSLSNWPSREKNEHKLFYTLHP